MYSSGEHCGDKTTIGIDHKFDCVHRFGWYRIHRNPDSARAFTESSLSYDLGCGYKRNCYAYRWLVYRVQNNQGAIKPSAHHQATMRLHRLPTI